MSVPHFCLVATHSDGSLEGLVENLAKRRVGVHHHGKLPDGRALLDGVGTLLNKVGSVDADDVNSDDFLRLLVEEDLGNSGS